ncbi:MAG: Hpt domain-containing protein, partial [Gammaproteobacteria bacterium]
ELEELLKEEGRIEEAKLLNLAAELLSVEDRLDAELISLIEPSGVGAEDAAVAVDPELAQVTEAVMRECIVNLAHLKEAVSQVLDDSGDSNLLDALPEQLRGITAGLLMLNKAQAVEIVNTIGVSISKLVNGGYRNVSDISLTRLADAIVSIEYYMETLRAGRKEPSYMLENAQRSLEAIDLSEVLPATPEEEPVSHDATLRMTPEEVAVVAEVETEKSAVEEAPEHIETIASETDMAVLKTDDAQPDPELLEIFIEEAREEIANIGRQFPVWASDFSQLDVLNSVRRSFHTLKGSGRMVGAELMGNYCWQIENLLNRIINQTIEPDVSMAGFLRGAVNGLPQILEQLEVGTPPGIDIGGILAAADAFIAGRGDEVAAHLIVAGETEEVPEEAPAEAEEIMALETEESTSTEPSVVDVEPIDEPVIQETSEPVIEMDPVLLEILTKETAGHLANIHDFLRECENASAPFPVTEDMHRACHTLHGSITMADAREVAVLSDPLNQIVEHAYAGGGMSTDVLDAVRDAVLAIESVVEAMTSGGVQPNIDATQERLGLLAEATAEEVETPVEEVVEEDPIPAPEFDAEIAAIFSEEAAEILEAADTALSSFPTDGSDISALEELQRHLHTLKGGARMAGITATGDFSHELETLVVRLGSGFLQINPGITALLQACIDELHRMREQVLGGVLTQPGPEILERLSQALTGTVVALENLEPAEKITLSTEDAQAEVTEAEVTEAEDAKAEVVEADDENLEEFVISVEEIQESAEEDIALEEQEQEDAESAAEVEELVAEELTSSGTFSLPEPDRLGELAKELTQSRAPDAVEKPLPNVPGTAKSGTPDPLQGRRELARVDPGMLENLLNNAGEVSIFHSRFSQQLGAIQFNLEELSQTVSRLHEQLRKLEIETEAQILHRHQDESTQNDEFDPLELDRYSTIQQLSRALSETASDVTSIKDLLQSITGETEALLVQQARTTAEMQDTLMRTRMVPFHQHIPRLSRLVRQAATESAKNVELVVDGSTGELDRQVMEKMLPPFEHMLRNAVIHGIETPEERARDGKPETGKISISFDREGSEVVIRVKDDGRGLNVKAIRKKAEEQGLLNPGQDIEDEEVMQFVLRSGFSTAGKLTQSAGRGIGMDVVVSEITKLGGALDLHSSAGNGCAFVVRLPYTLAVTQAFIVRVGPEIYALPLPSVEGVIRIPREEFDQRLCEEEPHLVYAGEKYFFRHLGQYLGLGPTKLSPYDAQVPLILVRAGEHSTALIADETMDNREIVVKPLGPQLSTIRGVAGATILGDGRIVVILDVSALLRASTVKFDTSEPVVIETAEELPRALVVDDSITMRRISQRLLERNGFMVDTAKDGLEALEVLQEHRPDIILLDIEMPRMDGYEFATNVRNDANTAELPIVMITSRAGEKHRARAIEIGVNDFLGKPYQEHELLEAIRNLIGDVFSQ